LGNQYTDIVILKTITCTSRPTNTGPRYDRQVFMIKSSQVVFNELMSIAQVLHNNMEKNTHKTHRHM